MINRVHAISHANPRRERSPSLGNGGPRSVLPLLLRSNVRFSCCLASLCRSHKMGLTRHNHLLLQIKVSRRMNRRIVEYMILAALIGCVIYEGTSGVVGSVTHTIVVS